MTLGELPNHSVPSSLRSKLDGKNMCFISLLGGVKTGMVTKQRLGKYYLKVDEETEARRHQGTCVVSASQERTQILTQLV